MDENYPIEVLHIVNPHVMFVEATSADQSVVIEQVGIYGILPVNQTIDIDGQVVFERCENWSAASCNVMREFFCDYKHCVVYFVPIQDERRSTIFNNSDHRFGDIIVKEKGRIISLTDCLVTIAVAEKNECVFHQRLASGSLKLKLNTVRSEEVLNAIKKYYRQKEKGHGKGQAIIKKQTSLYEESKNITNKLTAKNLELLRRNTEFPFDISLTIERKTRDLNLCKDADEVSVGCGSRRTKYNHSDSLTTVQYPEKSPFNILNKVKKYCDTNGRRRDTVREKYTHDLRKYDYLNQSTLVSESPVSYKESCQIEKQHNLVDNWHETNERQLTSQAQLPLIKCKSRLDRNSNSNGERKIDDHYRRQDDSVPCKASKSPTAKLDKKYLNERLVVYGPPMEYTGGINQLVVKKIVEQDLLMAHPARESTKTQEVENTEAQEVEKTNYDDYAQEDSNVSFNVGNVDGLKKLRSHRDKIDRAPNDDAVNCVSNSQKLAQPILKSKDTVETEKRLLNLLSRKSRAHRTRIDNYLSSHSDTSVKDTSSSSTTTPNIPAGVEDIDAIKEKLNAEYKPYRIQKEKPIMQTQNVPKTERNVNPFKNLDGSKSIFVDKLVSPILMVHTKNDNLILPQHNLRDIPFKSDIHSMLKQVKVKEPNRLQTVSWSYILRGHSVFLIGPAGSGKTLGYIPAVCNLVIDSIRDIDSSGPICIIVCATAASVTDIEDQCKRFLDLDEVVLACFPGVEMGRFMTALLNGCHILVCTAAMLFRLLGDDFGVDLRRLTTLVFEDCERLSTVYASEITVILHHVKSMLKNRVDKSLKVQYVVASRQWCEFLTPLAKNAPDTVIAIAAFQECVLYSKTSTTVKFVMKDNKVNAVVEFLKQIDSSKRTVIVCRADDEVEALERTLKKLKYAVFACNSAMTLHDLYSLNVTWDYYEEPVLGPILICCDGNLMHLNVTNANYLVHFSMPAMFSSFCKRFSVLNDNYASIFGPENENVKIQILLEESNVEQLPKILHFVKRCTKEVAPRLNVITDEVLAQKDLIKAKNLVPICNNLLTLGECIDLWNCQERHTILKEFDEPKTWMPKQGLITFKITHFDSAVSYSARLLTNVTKSRTIKYPNNFSTLSLKMGLHFSKESNRRLHGIPKVGDVCAVAAKLNFFERCKVMKILSYSKGKPHDVLINLIDEERLDISKDVFLYHLPEDLKAVETHVVQVRLANIQPQDKDVTFSVLAKDQLRRMTESDDNIYLRGEVVLTVSNCIFVDTLEACQDLTSLGETVVKHDLKEELLSRHAEPNPQHVQKLKKLSGVVDTVEEKSEIVVSPKIERHPKWAHLDKDDFSTVIFASAIDAGSFFVRMEKFSKVVDSLISDIRKHVETSKELSQEEIYVGNIVLAEFPDDETYERARIDSVIDDRKVKCFFVDNGDWREVLVKNIRTIPENILHRIPFQAIECRLVGIKPPVDDWTEFGTNWLCDNCFGGSDGKMKFLFAKQCTKEEATITGGHKYGIILVDTSSDNDIIFNKMMIELNLAREKEDEVKHIDEPFNINRMEEAKSSWDEDDIENNSISGKETFVRKDLIPHQSMTRDDPNTESSLRHILFQKPIRSVPLVNDSDSENSDKWDINIDKGMMGMFGAPSKANVKEYKPENAAGDKENGVTTETTLSDKSNSDDIKTKDIVSSIIKNGESNSDISGIDLETSQTVNSTQIAESQSDVDSDDFDIGKDRIDALNILKTQLSHKEMIETSVKLNAIQIHNKNDHEKVTAEHACKVEDRTANLGNNDLDSDDLSSVTSVSHKNETIQNDVKIKAPKPVNIVEVDPPRKPKLIWRQNKASVTLKIQLIGVEEYSLIIRERYIKFSSVHNDTTYEFELELYGVINPDKSAHSNKGQYIQVSLIKILQRNWLSLTRDSTVKKWISYDVDAIESGSEVEERPNEDVLKVIKHNFEKEDTESDEDFDDDANFTYKKHLD